MVDLSVVPDTGVGVSFVLYHEDPAVFAQALLALERQGIPAQRIAVWVNDTQDDQVPALQGVLLACGVPAECLHLSPDNLGFSGGHNANMERLFSEGADRVLVLNADVVLSPGAVQLLSERAAQVHDRVLVGPLLELAREDGRGEGLIDTAGIRWTTDARHLDDLQGRPMAEAPTEVRRVRGLSGACLLVTRICWEIVRAATGEFFDEDFLAYREDAELGLRAEALGVPSELVPASRGRHRRRLRGTRRGEDPAVDRLGVQNRFLLAFTHGRHRPGLLPAVLARDVLVVGAVLVKERSSLPGLRRAWTLRHRARAKGRAVWSNRSSAG